VNRFLREGESQIGNTALIETATVQLQCECEDCAEECAEGKHLAIYMRADDDSTFIAHAQEDAVATQQIYIWGSTGFVGPLNFGGPPEDGGPEAVKAFKIPDIGAVVALKVVNTGLTYDSSDWTMSSLAYDYDGEQMEWTDLDIDLHHHAEVSVLGNEIGCQAGTTDFTCGKNAAMFWVSAADAAVGRGATPVGSAVDEADQADREENAVAAAVGEDPNKTSDANARAGVHVLVMLWALWAV
jgi:hypothetical protein